MVWERYKDTVGLQRLGKRCLWQHLKHPAEKHGSALYKEHTVKPDAHSLLESRSPVALCIEGIEVLTLLH